ncbi:MAG: DUF4304 domain-containing protein [Clostridia bacterium]|nr:DUF4304 domain-containing protein [Clostridia bacterium]
MIFGFLSKPQKINSIKILDEIENAVYEHVKPLGFKKHGRTLHRFVSEDISQVINFQYANSKDMEGLFCVNLGVRIPECSERTFHPNNPEKKYYHEYECTLRSRLGSISGKREIWFNLRKNTKRIISSIISELDKVVIPAFSILVSREAIIAHRKNHPLDFFNKLTLFDESMIYGHLGNLEQAKELFEIYYQSVVDDYNEKDGYVTLYGASHGYIDNLDKLALELGIR